MVLEEEKLRFRWDDMPAVSVDLPGTGGEIRTIPDDFVVTEIPSYLPSGSGTHAYAFVEKRGLTTRDLVNALKKQGVPERAIGVAGLKDKQAVTRQWISVPQEFSDNLYALDYLDGAQILEKSRHKNKLGVGHLRGNRFEIRVRNPHSDWLTRAKAILGRIETVGLPNYFGPQRYGRFNSNVIDAMRLVNGESLPGGRKLHGFFMGALQSHLFNWILKLRVERGLLDKALAGDMAQKHDTGGMFVVENGNLESDRASRLEISATIPLYGKRVRVSSGNAGEVENEVLEYFGLKWDDLRRLHGARRMSRAVATDTSLEAAEGGYIVGFTLPSGAFATCLLRELLKTDVE